MKRKLFSVIYILSILLFSNIQAAVYNITDFGAVADGKTVNTTAVQKAIDTCNQSGGGTVTVPTGTYITGTIRLLSHVNLHLESGAKLSGSTDLADYTYEGKRHGLIFAGDAVNISITGRGEINGNGTSFMTLDKSHISADFVRARTRQGEKFMPADELFEDGPVAYEDRPGMMIVFLKCENVHISDVTLVDSPSWTMRLGDCDNVVVRGIAILNNLLVPNSDGIHCTTSRNVRISDCDIRAGDDAIIVTGFGIDTDVHGDQSAGEAYSTRKTGNKTGYAENITVTNCTLMSRSSGIRVGYGDNNIRNCTFQNLVIYSSNRGLGVFARDLAVIENILFSDIIINTRLHSGHWWGNGEPIHVSAIAQSEGYDLGRIKNVRFSNIFAEAETGILVYGDPESPVEDVSFDNVQLRINNSPLNPEYGGNIDLRPSKGPETQIFQHDISGLYARYVNGLTISNFKLSWADGLPEFFDYGLHVEQFNDLIIDGFIGRQPHINNTRAAIALNDGSGVTIRNCVAADGTGLFIAAERVANAGLIVNNDIRRAKKMLKAVEAEFKADDNLYP